MLRQRVITAIWGIPLLFIAIWFDEPLPWFTLLVAIWGVLAAFEFYRMVAAAKVSPLTYFGMLWVLLLILSPHFNPEFRTPLLLTSAVVTSIIWLLLRRDKREAFASWAWTIAGILYIGWLLSHMTALRGLDDGRNWVCFVFVITLVSDTTAYFAGRALGRHRLAPQVSPGKTWEGAIAGIFSAIIFSFLFIMATPLRLPLSYGQTILLGFLVSVFGQVGDLAESLLKRDMGVKDSGRMIPGHGGVLDRLDSIIFAGLVVHYYVVYFI
ncbi:phosphatidate cytidylyltransferase [Chloroflexota bacterium]